MKKLLSILFVALAVGFSSAQAEQVTTNDITTNFHGNSHTSGTSWEANGAAQAGSSAYGVTSGVGSFANSAMDYSQTGGMSQLGGSVGFSGSNFTGNTTYNSTHSGTGLTEAAGAGTLAYATGTDRAQINAGSGAEASYKSANTNFSSNDYYNGTQVDHTYTYEATVPTHSN